MRQALALAAAILVASSASALACNIVHTLGFEVEGGEHDVFVNGVFVSRDDSASVGSRPIFPRDWLLPGENTVTIAMRERDGVAKANFQVTADCMGEVAESAPLASVSFDGPGEQALNFTVEAAVEAEHLLADPSGQDGLLEAVARLQQAVAAKDANTVIAMHAPMMREAERAGAPLVQVRRMISFLVTEHPADLAADLASEAALDGKIHVVTTTDRLAPVTIMISEDDGSMLTWRTGVYWGRYDGAWGVVALYNP